MPNYEYPLNTLVKWLSKQSMYRKLTGNSRNLLKKSIKRSSVARYSSYMKNKEFIKACCKNPTLQTPNSQLKFRQNIFC